MVESESEVMTDIPETAQEEMIAKSRVNDIVKREKAAAADKVRREMEALHAQEIEGLKSAQSPSPGATPDSGQDIRSTFNQWLSEERERYQEEENRREEEARQAELKKQIDESAHHYLMKVDQGKGDFPDFDEVMKDFDIRAFSGVALLAGQMDNTAAIMYDLSKNPEKAVKLHSMAQVSPETAAKEMKKLSDSIAKNQQAAASNVQTNAPLSRLKSSTVAGADNGQMGIRDYKNADWLRG